MRVWCTIAKEMRVFTVDTVILAHEYLVFVLSLKVVLGFSPLNVPSQ